LSDIGKKIKQLRIEKGMTQEELARRVGYKTKSSINKIESSRDFPIKKIIPFADALGVSPSELMGWDEEPEHIPDDDVFGQLMADLGLSDEQKRQVEFYAKYLLETDNDK